MGRSKTPSFCQNCDKQMFAYTSAAGKYCSISCMQAVFFKARFDLWMAGKEEVSARWLRRALAERDGKKCAVCNLEDWCNKPITLELDHIDGDHANNSHGNLRLICPNCHSQTDTYKNRNAGRGRPERRKAAKTTEPAD